MSLVEYAKSELERAGLFDEDSDYNGMLGKATLELIEVFADQGHSGFSAHLVRDLFNKLADFKPITELTYGPEEWNEVGEGMWQNKRNPCVFSTDGGKTHYSLD